MDPAATDAGTRKQAMFPDGATVLEPVGTAPGLVVPPPAGQGGPPIAVLPGPPRELQGMWPALIADPLVLAALAERTELRQHTVRLWGTPESEIAATLRDLGAALDGLEITTCLRDGELEIVTRYGPSAQPGYDDFVTALRSGYPDTLFSADGHTIDELVAASLTGQRLTIATAESCTAGLLSGRLTDLAGSSAFLLGGLVVYSNQAKRDLAGVSSELLDTVGAVSAEVAQALADGARRALQTDIGVGITGIAGPDGGTPDKPVGLVYICASRDGRTLARRLLLSGTRADVRSRTVSIAMHLILDIAT
jgi:nicotinamide-nucleotide amidase